MLSTLLFKGQLCDNPCGSCNSGHVGGHPAFPETGIHCIHWKKDDSGTSVSCCIRAGESCSANIFQRNQIQVREDSLPTNDHINVVNYPEHLIVQHLYPSQQADSPVAAKVIMLCPGRRRGEGCIH